ESLGERASTRQAAEARLDIRHLLQVAMSQFGNCRELALVAAQHAELGFHEGGDIDVFRGYETDGGDVVHVVHLRRPEATRRAGAGGRREYRCRPGVLGWRVHSWKVWIGGLLD